MTKICYPVRRGPKLLYCNTEIDDLEWPWCPWVTILRYFFEVLSLCLRRACSGFQTKLLVIRTHCSGKNVAQAPRTRHTEFLRLFAGVTNFPVADVKARQRLRSASSSSLIVGRTRLSTVEDRAFPIAAARIWDNLIYLRTSLLHLRCLSRTIHLFRPTIFCPSPLSCTMPVQWHLSPIIILEL